MAAFGKFQHHTSLAELHSFKESNQQTLEERRLASMSAMDRKIRAAHEARMKAKQQGQPPIKNTVDKDTIEIEARRAKKLAALDSLIDFNREKFIPKPEVVVETLSPRASETRKSNLSSLELKVLAAHEKRMKDREIKNKASVESKGRHFDKDTPRTEARRANKLDQIDQIVLNDPTYIQHQIKLVAVSSMIDFAKVHLSQNNTNEKEDQKKEIIVNPDNNNQETLQNNNAENVDNDDNHSVDTLDSEEEEKDENTMVDLSSMSPQRMKVLVDFVHLAHQHVLENHDQTCKEGQVEEGSASTNSNHHERLAALDEMVEFAKNHLS